MASSPWYCRDGKPLITLGAKAVCRICPTAPEGFPLALHGSIQLHAALLMRALLGRIQLSHAVMRARPPIHAPRTTLSPARHGLRVEPAMTALLRLSCRTRSGIHATPEQTPTAKPCMGGLFLAIRACRLGWLFLRPRRMYEQPQANRILRSCSDLRELFEHSDEGTTRVLSQGRRNRQPRFPDGTEGCRGRHVREEQSAHARLCREPLQAGAAKLNLFRTAVDRLRPTFYRADC